MPVVAAAHSGTLTIAPDDKFRSVFYKRSLFHFAELGNIEKLAEMLDREQFPASVHDRLEGFTAILAAANADQHEVVQFLIERGADVDCECGVRILNDSPNTPICHAAFFGFEDTVGTLIRAGASLRGAIVTAASSGHVGVVMSLVEAGADIDEEVDAPTGIITTISRMDSVAATGFEVPCAVGRNTTAWPLLLVVTPPPSQLRVFETASLLIQLGANVNLERDECTEEHPGRTVLQIVVARYFRKMVEKMNNRDQSPPRRILLAISVLIANGADLDAKYCEEHGGDSVRALAATDPILNAVVQSSAMYHDEKKLEFTQMLMRFVTTHILAGIQKEREKLEKEKEENEARRDKENNKPSANEQNSNHHLKPARSRTKANSSTSREEFLMCKAIDLIVEYLPGITDVMVGKLQKEDLIAYTVPQNYLDLKLREVERARAASRWPIDVEAFMLKRQA